MGSFAPLAYGCLTRRRLSRQTADGDRAAKTPPEVVEAQLRLHGGEEGVSVQIVVADRLEQTAMELSGAALGYDVDIGP